MLQFILGRCGNGKSQKLREIIKRKLKYDSQNKIILIVPEQSSFFNEKKMLEVLGNADFNRIHVLSFSRLYDFVSRILNMPSLSTTENTAQIIMMNAAMENVKNQLKLYKKNTANSEIAEIMLDTFKKLKSNKINMETLNKIEKLSGQDTLKQKINEIKIIINSYEALTENNFADTIDTLNKLENIIKLYKVFQGYDIFFDEFSNFTPQQLGILEIIIQQAQNIYMAFCCEKNSLSMDEKNIFSCVSKTINKIKKIAQKHKIDIAPLITLTKTSRFNNVDLSLLEENIFNPKKVRINHAPQNIHVYNALDQTEECEHIARTIRKLIIEQNYRYKDFAVLTRNMDNYSGILKNTFKKYDIPYFLDSPEKIFHKSLTNLIFAAIESINSNFDSNEIFRFIKCGLIELSHEDIALVENYILLWGITGKEWSHEFKLHPKGFGYPSKPEDVIQLEEINKIRKKIIKPLEDFRARTHKATGKEISKAIYDLLIEIKTPENLRNLCSEFSKIGERLAAEQEARVWDIVINLIDEMAKVFANTRISCQKYGDILMSVIDSISFSSIPQSIDNVVIGAANRIRLSEPKIVFVVGAINGEFPKTPNSSEIFTDTEINHIASLGIEITDTTENFIMQERFLAYVVLSNASQHLFISWPSSSLSGKGNLPSEIIKETKEIFPNLKILNRFNFSHQEIIWNEKSAFEICAQNWKNNSPFANELKKYFTHNPAYKDKCMSLQKHLETDLLNFKNPQIATQFFNKNLRLSASQIEKYYTCRFGYFCEYALKAKPQRTAQFGAPEYGNIVHYIMENLFKKYSQNKITQVSYETIHNEINHITNNYVEKQLGGFQNKPERFIYLIEKLKSSVNFLIKYFVEEIKQSLFIVSDVELQISETGDIPPLVLKLPNNGEITLEGKIDRIDIMHSENGNYIRIIDYKTGTKEFKLSDVLYGLNTQMLIYLLALTKNENKKYGKTIPAGILYLHALKPLLDAKNLKDLEISQNQIQKKLRMNGILLHDLNAIYGMEKEAKGIFIPAEIKNGEIKKSSSVTTLSELLIIETHVENLIKKMAISLQKGEISANPICKKYTACEWCPYFAICRYEKEDFINIPTSLPNKKIFEEMAKEDSENNG